MMRRVLIVSPHFPPVNAPDHQRVRMSLPYLFEFGWLATILCVAPESIEAGLNENRLLETVPEDIPVIRVNGLSYIWTRPFGFGDLSMRMFGALNSAGMRLLEEGDFDLVFFSTTQFPLTVLGPIWRRRVDIPYVVDFQDPWLDDYYERTGTPPPGGKLRYGVSRIFAGQLEPRVMKDVSQVIAVSPAYVETLRNRYSDLKEDQFTVLPFGAPEKDFDLLQTLNVQQRVFDSEDGNEHWLYIGAAGRIMQSSLRLLFSTIASLRGQEPEAWRKVRLHFAGTSYAPEKVAERTVETIAAQYGIADIVDEKPNRFPYFETLQALTEADALLVIGSDSPSYSASKLYPYILARKPMLSLLHEKSPAVKTIKQCQAGELVTFDPSAPDQSASVAREALKRLRLAAAAHRPPVIDWQQFQSYTAREMTRRLCQVFDRASGDGQRVCREINSPAVTR